MSSAAHISGTADPSRPSIFDILSHQSFNRALKPAFLHLIKTLSERNPEGCFADVFRRFDEVYLLVESLVQFYYIKTRGGLIGEAFYSLQRTPVTSKGLLKSTQLRVRFSFLTSIMVPYLIAKLQKLSEESIHDENGESSKLKSLKKFFRAYLPYFRNFFSVINLYYLTKYLFYKSNYHNLIFKLFGVKLQYLPDDRRLSIVKASETIFSLQSWKDARKVPYLLLTSLGEGILFGIELGSFVLQFLDWFYNDNSNSRLPVSSSAPIPRAPHSNTLPDQHLDRCPLCRQELRNPTVLSTTGIVYCFGCITPYLKTQRSCPVTNVPSRIENLIRIFT